MNAVDVSDLRVQYERVTALTGVDLVMPRGIAVGVVGPNGSGKSTLLKAIAGLVVPAAGSVTVLGKRPRDLPPGTIGYVPQIEDVDWQFPANVRDVVSMGRYPRLGPFARFGPRDRRAVDDALEALDLTALAGRHIAQLSGGQQQRAFLARAIAQEPDLLLLDEPTTGVDAATEQALLTVVRGLVARGMPVLMTTHDLERAAQWFDRLIVVDRRLIADGPPAEVLAAGTYTQTRDHAHMHGHPRADRGSA